MIVHGEEVGDRIVGIMGGYIRWSGLVEEPTKAIRSPNGSPAASSTRSRREIILRADTLR